MKLRLFLVASVALGSARAASAQQPNIPVNSRPPAGMCRIWLDGVPATQQPAPTDCATAVKNRPDNGHVIFGDDFVSRGDTSHGRNPLPAITGFAPGQSDKKPPLRRFRRGRP